jgi:hypothetical protein
MLPKPELKELPTPPEMTELQAMLAQQAVTAEMANPAGLRLDEPVTDVVSQYKADVRAILAGHPQDLTTALAAKESIVENFITPEAQTAPPVPPPEPEPPELLSLTPDTASNLVSEVGVTFAGGPFDETCEAMADGVALATTFVNPLTLTATLIPSVPDAESTVDCFVRQGDTETAHLPFVFTYEAPPPPPEEEPQAATQPVVEGA